MNTVILSIVIIVTYFIMALISVFIFSYLNVKTDIMDRYLTDEELLLSALLWLIAYPFYFILFIIYIFRCIIRVAESMARSKRRRR